MPRPRHRKITPAQIAEMRENEPDYPEMVCFECFERKIPYRAVVVKRTGEVVEYCECWKGLVQIRYGIFIE